MPASVRHHEVWEPIMPAVPAARGGNIV